MSCISAILAHRSAVSPLNRAYRQILPTDRLSGGAECQADRRRDESCSLNRAYRQILPSDRWSGGAECQADRRRDESCSLNRAYRQILPTDRLSGGAECQADRQRSGALCQSDPQIGGTAERRRRPGRLRSVFAYSGQGEGLPASLLVYADGSYPRMYSASTAARPSSYRNTGLMSSSAMSSARSQAKCEMSTSAFVNASLSSGGWPR